MRNTSNHWRNDSQPSLLVSATRIKRSGNSIASDFFPEQALSEDTCSQVHEVTITQSWNQLLPVCWLLQSLAHSYAVRPISGHTRSGYRQQIKVSEPSNYCMPHPRLKILKGGFRLPVQAIDATQDVHAV
jgi:hypothetical protein